MVQTQGASHPRCQSLLKAAQPYVCVCRHRRCLFEILRAVKLGATITMVFPKEDQATFFRTVTTDFETVRAAFEAFSVADAQAAVEADKWMIWELIQSEYGPRKAVESICEKLGLDISGKVILRRIFRSF